MQTLQAAHLINALNETFGRHTGARASHAKGINVRGVFTPATNTTDNPIPALQRSQTVTARFSIGGGEAGYQ